MQPAPVAPQPVPQPAPAPAEPASEDEEGDQASIPPSVQNEEPEESEELVSLNVQSKKDFKNVFRKLQVNFGESFETQKLNRPYCLTPRSNQPLLILDAGDEPSWFNPEKGYFSTAELPPKKSNFLPPDLTPNVATQRLPYFSFKDPQLKDLLEAKPLEKAILDSLAFSDPTPVGIKNSPHTNLDTLLRSGMYDFLIVDKLFQFIFTLLEMVQTESQSSDTGETFSLLGCVMGLAAQTSLRASQSVSAAFVANRVALRESVLDKFDGLQHTIEVLRGSPFASKDLFGPLPDSLLDKLSAANGDRFVLHPKSAQGGSQQPKRRTPAPSAPAPKRRRTVSAPVIPALQRPQSQPAPSTSSGANFRRQGKPRGRGYQKKRGGYS